MTAAVEAPLLEQLDADDRPLVGGGLRVSAHLVLGASLSLALASLVLVVLNRPEWTSDQWYYVVDVADAVVYGVVAWALLARIQHPVAWLVALTAVGGGLAALGAQWFQYHLAHPDTPALDLLSSMSALGWVPGTLRGDDVAGMGVVIARRICDLAEDGTVLVSRTVKELVTGSGIRLEDQGRHRLKGVPDLWHLYAAT